MIHLAHCMQIWSKSAHNNLLDVDHYDKILFLKLRFQIQDMSLLAIFYLPFLYYRNKLSIISLFLSLNM